MFVISDLKLQSLITYPAIIVFRFITKDNALHVQYPLVFQSYLQKRADLGRHGVGAERKYYLFSGRSTGDKQWALFALRMYWEAAAVDKRFQLTLPIDKKSIARKKKLLTLIRFKILQNDRWTVRKCDKCDAMIC